MDVPDALEQDVYRACSLQRDDYARGRALCRERIGALGKIDRGSRHGACERGACVRRGRCGRSVVSNEGVEEEYWEPDGVA
jgi:hypothetical protein